MHPRDRPRPTDALTRFFPSSVRDRGRIYHDAGAVDLVACDEDSAHARVRGSRWYTVTLRLTAEGLETSCECPYFAGDGSVCKHIWATLLSAEAEGFGGTVDTG